MRVCPINIPITNHQRTKNVSIVNFEASPKISPEKMVQCADLRVFHHHIYEYKKGIRNLILTTEKSVYKKPIEEKLTNEKIDYVIHDISNDKINVYFGEKPCVDVVKTFNPKLNMLTPEQDFMLGIMLGYDRVKQCLRYMSYREKWGKKNL